MQNEYRGPGRRFGKPRPAEGSPRKIAGHTPAYPAKPKQKGRPKHRHERLPDGSKAEAMYLAQREIWVGRVSIPDNPRHAAVAFSGEAKAFFTLFDKIDKKYRDWLRENGVK